MERPVHMCTCVFDSDPQNPLLPHLTGIWRTMIGSCTSLPKVAQKGSAASLGSSQALGYPNLSQGKIPWKSQPLTHLWRSTHSNGIVPMETQQVFDLLGRTPVVQRWKHQVAHTTSPVWHPKRGEHEPGIGNILLCWLHILTTAIRHVSAWDPKAHSYMNAW